MAKKAPVCKTSRELNKLVKLIPDNKQIIAKNIVKELVFITKTLDDLKEKIEADGTVELFEQGKQKFYRESPALKSYNTTIQRYSLLYKQLIDLLPKETAASNGDGELLDFINGGQ